MNTSNALQNLEDPLPLYDVGKEVFQESDWNCSGIFNNNQTLNFTCGELSNEFNTTDKNQLEDVYYFYHVSYLSL